MATITDKIFDTYLELDNGEMSPRELIAETAKTCKCDEDLVLATLLGYHKESETDGEEPIIQMYATRDGEASLGVASFIGDILIGEDVSEDPDGIAFLGIQVLASGIATLASSMIRRGHFETEDVLTMTEESLQTAFDGTDMPKVSESIIEDDDSGITLSSGKIMHFPS